MIRIFILGYFWFFCCIGLTDSQNVPLHGDFSPSCENCLDLDPTTEGIPSHLDFVVDAGFYGDLTFNLTARLRPMEKMVINLNKKGHSIVLVNYDQTNNSQYGEYKCSFKYPASKLKLSPIKIFLEPTTKREIQDFSTIYKEFRCHSSQNDCFLFSNIHSTYFEGIEIQITQH